MFLIPKEFDFQSEHNDIWDIDLLTNFLLNEHFGIEHRRTFFYSIIFSKNSLLFVPSLVWHPTILHFKQIKCCFFVMVNWKTQFALFVHKRFEISFQWHEKSIKRMNCCTYYRLY